MKNQMKHPLEHFGYNKELGMTQHVPNSMQGFYPKWLLSEIEILNNDLIQSKKLRGNQ